MQQRDRDFSTQLWVHCFLTMSHGVSQGEALSKESLLLPAMERHSRKRCSFCRVACSDEMLPLSAKDKHSRKRCSFFRFTFVPSHGKYNPFCSTFFRPIFPIWPCTHSSTLLHFFRQIFFFLLHASILSALPSTHRSSLLCPSYTNFPCFASAHRVSLTCLLHTHRWS